MKRIFDSHMLLFFAFVLAVMLLIAAFARADFSQTPIYITCPAVNCSVAAPITIFTAHLAPPPTPPAIVTAYLQRQFSLLDAFVALLAFILGVYGYKHYFEERKIEKEGMIIDEEEETKN